MFFTDEDRRYYLALLRKYAAQHGVEVLAYCLMANHVHLVAVPASQDSLHRVLKPVHMRHAQRINRARGWNGHLWQGRFFSSVLDEAYLWAAIRYVERNPVRAGMVDSAERYPWSSAPAHCGRGSDPLLTRAPYWQEALDAIKDWPAWLAGEDDGEKLVVLRRNARMGLPCGSEPFIRSLEKATGGDLHYRPQGKRKEGRSPSGYQGSVP